MTVESAQNKSGPFIASGTSGTFPRNFLVLDGAHVRVVRSRGETETDLTSGISHTGIGTAAGSVTISQGIQSGDRITLLRNVPNVQRSDYSAQSSVPADQVELDLDLMAMQVQDMAERQRRALTLPVDSTISNTEATRIALKVPEYAARAEAAAIRAVAAAQIVESVLTFGAKGDGVADDTAAFQAAADAVKDGRLLVPPGTYRVGNVRLRYGTMIECLSGAAQVTTAAAGNTQTAVSFRYIGAGGAGSRIFTLKASAADTWIKGGGIIGRPHLSGENACEILVDASSVHGGRFDLEMSRATFAGMSLNGGNGVISQFCDVDFKYIWGAQAATENSHGLILNGNHPDGVSFTGCTQHRIWSNGAVKNGDMVRMVGHCDNNHLWVHATQGLGAARGTGRSLAILQGNSGLAGRINHVHYCCGSIFLQVNSFGTQFDFLTSEGMEISGGGQYSISRLFDYITGKVYTSKAAPLTEYRFISAAQLMPTGAAVKELAAGTPILRLPKSGDAGAAISLHDQNWGAGVISGVEWLYRGSGSGNALLSIDLTASREGEGIAPDLTTTEVLAVSGSNVQRQSKVLAIPLTAYGFAAIHTWRLPANPNDTLAGNLELLGVNVRIDFNGPASLLASIPVWKETK